MKTAQRAFLAGVSIFAICLFAIKMPAATAIDPDADRIFKSACKYLAEAKGFCVKVEVWKDVVLPTGLKLQTTKSLEVQQQRPDQLHIEARSPRESKGFWYQNKSLTMLDRSLNLYGVMEVPKSIDKAIDAVEERFGIEIPLGDVLVSDPYQNMIENMETGDNLGKATVLGTTCNHLVFTGANADCQIWIAEGAKPLPRKIVINFKTIEGSPQVTQIFFDWDVVSPISESVFNFVAPVGAGKIVVNPKRPETASDGGATENPANSTVQK
jgi:hypothetical protein